jgi:hypothetical protein
MPAMLRDSTAGRRASLSLGEDKRWHVVRTQPHREFSDIRFRIHLVRRLEHYT